VLEKHLRYGGKLLGICGGMQMLGEWIEDDGVEDESTQGLGWLPLSTSMQIEKTLRQVDQLSNYPERFRVTGYEIHHGESGADNHLFPFSACSDDKQIWGTYVHGLFEQGTFRKAWLNEMGFAVSDGIDQQQRTLASLDLLADTLERELTPALLQPLLATRSHRQMRYRN